MEELKLKEKIDSKEPKKDIKKPAAKAKGKKKDVFSIHFMKLLDEGINGKTELQKKLKVLPIEFEQKIKELYDKNYIGFDDHDKNIIWKTIKGFNEFPPKEKKEKKPAEQKAEKPEIQKLKAQIEADMQQKEPAVNFIAKPVPAMFRHQLPLQDLFAKKSELNVETELKRADGTRFGQRDAGAIIFEPKSEEEIVKYFESREGEIGRLEELIKKGAPKQGQILPKLKQFSERLLGLEERLQRDAPQNTPGQTRIIIPKEDGNLQGISQEKQASSPKLQSPQIQAQIAMQKQQIQAIQNEQTDGNEKCELCKSPFKLSIQENEMAKFGHCFCGAAYHKDCYDHLLSTEKRCLRCNSELKLQLDQKSKEALSKIKQMF